VTGTYYGKFSEPHLYFVWQLPAEHDDNTIIITSLISLLAGTKTSYLNRILINEKKLAKEITISLNAGKLCSQLYLIIKPNQGIELKEIEDEVKELLADFLKQEITESNLNRIKTKKRTQFIASYEDVTYRASILHNSLFIYGDSHTYKEKLNLIDQLDVETAHTSFSKFLTEQVAIFYVLPTPPINKMIKDATRDIPKIDGYPLIKTPQIKHKKLKNGLEVILVERSQSLDIHLKVDYAFGSLTDSKKDYGRLNFINHLKQIADQDDFNTVAFNQTFEELGASYGINSSLNWSDAYLYVPQQDFEKALALFYKFLFKTKFSEQKFEQEKEKLLFELSQPFATSVEFESYIENALIYPQDHPLAIPDSEKGTYKSIHDLSFEEVLKLHEQNHLTKIKRVVVVGAELEERVLPLLEQYFGHLPAYDYHPLDLPVVPVYEKSKVYLIQDETLSQDNISLSTIMSPDLDGLDPAYEVLKECFSHSFNGRINLNLREDKTWTYGVRGTGKNIPNATSYGLSVKIEQNHTIDAIKEILSEFYKLLNTEPLTEQEYENAIRTLNLHLIPHVQTGTSIAQHVLWLARKKFPDHWIEEQQQKYLSQNVKQVQAYIHQHLNNKQWVWIIRGDVLKLKSQIEDLGIGEIEVLEIYRENYGV
jgi:zinc protease